MKLTNTERAAVLALLSRGVSAPKGREMGPDIDAKVASWLSRAVTDELNMFPGIVDEMDRFHKDPNNRDYIGLSDRLDVVTSAVAAIGIARFGQPAMAALSQQMMADHMEAHPMTASDLMELLFR